MEQRNRRDPAVYFEEFSRWIVQGLSEHQLAHIYKDVGDRLASCRSPAGYATCSEGAEVVPTEHAMYSGPADAVISRDRAQTIALAPIAQDGLPIEIKRRPADVPAFKPCTAHSGANSFDDEVAFEFGDGSDDHHNGPSQRAVGVDVLPEADELDPETVHLVEHFQQMPGRPRNAIARPDQQDIEATAAGVAH